MTPTVTLSMVLRMSCCSSAQSTRSCGWGGVEWGRGRPPDTHACCQSAHERATKHAPSLASAPLRRARIRRCLPARRTRTSSGETSTADARFTRASATGAFARISVARSDAHRRLDRGRERGAHRTDCAAWLPPPATAHTGRRVWPQALADLARGRPARASAFLPCLRRTLPHDVRELRPQ